MKRSLSRNRPYDTVLTIPSKPCKSKCTQKCAQFVDLYINALFSFAETIITLVDYQSNVIIANKPVKMIQDDYKFSVHLTDSDGTFSIDTCNGMINSWKINLSGYCEIPFNITTSYNYSPYSLPYHYRSDKKITLKARKSAGNLQTLKYVSICLKYCFYF